ncbi:MAG: Flp pilus assembly complex ATPase component TadA [Planctomycetaceae bacterium]|jgi:type IV pilus assembly protein PilB|nr:Flp pilus assembly complex ATPase component TadA [Planctomycetaceae bacterium]
MAKRANFLELLQRKGKVSAAQIGEANEMAQATNIKVAEALIKLGYVSSEDVARSIAEEYGREFVDIKGIAIPPAIVELVPESVARENRILPYQTDGDTLKIIMSDPNDIETLDKLRFILNRPIEPVLASPELILEAISRHYTQNIGESADSLIQEMTDTQIDFTATDAIGGGASNVADSDAPIVRLANLIIEEAVQLRASDIHIEPFEDRVRVRYRIDGVLVERDTVPKRLQGSLLSRFKIMSRLDVAERRRTQDGRIKLSLGDKELDLRVSVIPTNHGQSVVMRILDKDNIRVSLMQLGFAESDFKKFTSLIKRPNGIILVTGPTGSGKTTSLYAALNDLNTPTRKIITAEDPVEYYLPGINQVEIKHSIGLDFARVIRAMLRQAPNIILVGEMRDLETAQMGIQASLTGHLVFSTLHTNDAPGAITRLVDMGVPPYLVSSSVIGIMAQRLVRTICKKCKKPYIPSAAELEEAKMTPEEAAKATFMKGAGCGSCNKSGYRGRMAVFELMMMSAKIREMTFQQASTVEIRRAAKAEGMSTLFMDGIRKVARGLTTIEEVLRVARDEDDAV